jgi:murein DD-endopeptidase MepM/ murein hydrolase activator NlpD
MRKQKTTIIFIDNNQKVRKPILIPTFLIKYSKLIAFCFLTFLGIGIYTSVLFGKQYLVQQQQEITALVTKNKVYSKKLVNQYEYLTRQISEVNKLLISKGINETGAKSVDQIPKLTLSSEERNENLFLKYLGDFKNKLIITPLGFPIQGNISSSFGDRPNPINGKGKEFHSGMDIKADHGTLVKSTADGMVIFAGYKVGYGNLVILKHGENFKTLYGHLSKILVKEGEKIKADTFIGKVGSTGRSTGPHLHYEIHSNGKRINPKNFIDPN